MRKLPKCERKEEVEVQSVNGTLSHGEKKGSTSGAAGLDAGVLWGAVGCVIAFTGVLGSLSF